MLFFNKQFSTATLIFTEAPQQLPIEIQNFTAAVSGA
jgi:hypothetical protein